MVVLILFIFVFSSLYSCQTPHKRAREASSHIFKIPTPQKRTISPLTLPQNPSILSLREQPFPDQLRKKQIRERDGGLAPFQEALYTNARLTDSSDESSEADDSDYEWQHSSLSGAVSSSHSNSALRSTRTLIERVEKNEKQAQKLSKRLADSIEYAKNS